MGLVTLYNYENLTYFINIYSIKYCFAKGKLKYSQLSYIKRKKCMYVLSKHSTQAVTNFMQICHNSNDIYVRSPPRGRNVIV